MNIKETDIVRMTGEAGGFDATSAFLKRFAKLVAAHEREECAKVCEDNADDGTEGVWDDCCHNLARKIRARSKA